MKINLLLTSEKRLTYLMLSLSINASLIKNTSVFPTNCESLTDKFLFNITFIDLY